MLHIMVLLVGIFLRLIVILLLGNKVRMCLDIAGLCLYITRLCLDIAWMSLDIAGVCLNIGGLILLRLKIILWIILLIDNHGLTDHWSVITQWLIRNSLVEDTVLAMLDHCFGVTHYWLCVYYRDGLRLGYSWFLLWSAGSHWFKNC